MVDNFTATYNKGEGDIGIEIVSTGEETAAIDAFIAASDKIPDELITEENYEQIETATGNKVPTAAAVKKYVDEHSVQSLQFELISPTKPTTSVNPAVIGNNRKLQFRVTKGGVPRKTTNWLEFFINGVATKKNFEDDDGHIGINLNLGALSAGGNQYSNSIGVTMACDWTSQYSAVEGIHINYDSFPYVKSSTAWTSGNGNGYYSTSVAHGSDLKIPILKDQSGTLETDTSIKFLIYIHGGVYVRSVVNGELVKTIELSVSADPYAFTVYRYGGTATEEEAIKADYANHYIIGGGSVTVTTP